MPFDWFTIVAQIINFTVLLWLLRRFLYRPILDGLDARELRLKKILEEANRKNTEALQCKSNFENKLQDLERQRLEILKKAQGEAEEKRITLFNLAQEAADKMLRKRLKSVQNEIQHLQNDVLSKSVNEVYAIASKVLIDLSGKELQQVMVDKFLDQLETLQGNQHTALISALERSNNLISVNCAFELGNIQKTEIKNKFTLVVDVQETHAMTFVFKHVPDLIAGLELSIGGWKIAWSINNYLQVLQQHVSDLAQLVPLVQDQKIEPNLKHSQVTHH